LSFQIVGFRSSDSTQFVFLYSSQLEKTLSFKLGPHVDVDGALMSNFQLLDARFFYFSFDIMSFF